MQWLDSWTKMRPVIVEAVATDDSDAGKAMEMARTRMRQPDSAYAKAAYSVSYRYEDFSVPRANHDKDYYVYRNFGELQSSPTRPSASSAPRPARFATMAKAC